MCIVGMTPVNHVDPTGLKLQLPTNKESRKVIVSALKELLGSWIVIDINSSSRVTAIKYLPGTKQYYNSYGLVSRLVNHKKTVKVNVNKLYDNYHRNGTVYFNPKFDPSIVSVNPKTGYCEDKKRPSYIGLAHELIHADRYVRGVRISTNKKSKWNYLHVDRTTHIQRNVKDEELATVGLRYHKSNDYTENQIRQEHGLWLRGAY